MRPATPRLSSSLGLTIYRTFYGDESDQQWQRLLEKIREGVLDELGEHQTRDEDPETWDKVAALFQMDSRSDPEILASRTLEEVRQVYLDGTGGEPMNTKNNPWRIFMLADAEVLADPELGAIKVAAADYDAVITVPKNWRFGPQRYFGWIRMSPKRLLSLWFELEMYFLEDVGNDTAGRPGAWWDPALIRESPKPQPAIMEDKEVMPVEMREALHQFVFHQRGGL